MVFYNECIKHHHRQRIHSKQQFLFFISNEFLSASDYDKLHCASFEITSKYFVSILNAFWIWVLLLCVRVCLLFLNMYLPFVFPIHYVSLKFCLLGSSYKNPFLFLCCCCTKAKKRIGHVILNVVLLFCLCCAQWKAVFESVIGRERAWTEWDENWIPLGNGRKWMDSTKGRKTGSYWCASGANVDTKAINIECTALLCCTVPCRAPYHISTG